MQNGCTLYATAKISSIGLADLIICLQRCCCERGGRQDAVSRVGRIEWYDKLCIALAAYEWERACAFLCSFGVLFLGSGVGLIFSEAVLVVLHCSPLTADVCRARRIVVFALKFLCSLCQTGVSHSDAHCDRACHWSQ